MSLTRHGGARPIFGHGDFLDEVLKEWLLIVVTKGVNLNSKSFCYYNLLKHKEKIILTQSFLKELGIFVIWVHVEMN